jgi:hypothetical protein
MPGTLEEKPRMKMSIPSILLRAEGAVLLAAAVAMFAREDASWWLFAALFFVPDLAMLGYVSGARTGAAVYNAAHSTVIALPLAVIGITTDQSWLTAIALIWLAHIGFDRVIGYGLKYPEGFRLTHLARV